MLRRWWWIALAIVLASAAAALLLAAEFATLIALPGLDPAGPSPELGYGLLVLLVVFAVPAWAAGLTVLGIPLGLALRGIGRDGYVTAMLAGAIGGFLAELIVVAVMGGFQPVSLLLVYPALMLLPGAAAGLIVRRIAYRPK